MTKSTAPTFSRRTLTKTGVTAAAGLAASQLFSVPRTIAKQDGEVTFMNWDAVPGTPIETALNAFQEKTGISVNVQPTPTQDYETKMRTLLASGSPPDVMRINDNLVRDYAVAGQLLDLKSFIKTPESYIESLFTFPVTPEGTHPAWTVGTNPRAIFYNASMFEEHGVPLPPSTWTAEGWTWDDFIEAAKPLTNEDEQRFGALVYQETAAEQTWAVNNGVKTGLYSDDGTEFTLASPEGIEAMQWLADLTCVHKVQPPWSQLQQDQAANQLFAAGRIGMMFSPLGFTAYLRENVSDFTWDVAPVPAKVDQTQEGSLIVFCIPQDAANPEAAWQLLTFLSGEAGGNIFAENGYFIPILPNSAELISPGEEAPANIKLFTEAAQHQSSVSPSTYQEQAEQIYRPQLDLVYNCEQSAADVLPPLKEQIEQALAGEG
jgi:multiple sugar transport system substrate-binding protein